MASMQDIGRNALKFTVFAVKAGKNRLRKRLDSAPAKRLSVARQRPAATIAAHRQSRAAVNIR